MPEDHKTEETEEHGPSIKIDEIKDCDGIADAVKQLNGEDARVGDRNDLIKRAVELGCTDRIPDDWGIPE